MLHGLPIFAQIFVRFLNTFFKQTLPLYLNFCFLNLHTAKLANFLVAEYLRDSEFQFVSGFSTQTLAYFQQKCYPPP